MGLTVKEGEPGQAYSPASRVGHPFHGHHCRVVPQPSARVLQQITAQVLQEGGRRSVVQSRIRSVSG